MRFRAVTGCLLFFFILSIATARAGSTARQSGSPENRAGSAGAGGHAGGGSSGGAAGARDRVRRKPDLSAEISCKESVEEGDRVTIQTRVANEGEAEARSVKVTIYVNRSKVGQRTLNLGSGASKNVTIKWTAGRAGTYRVLAKAVHPDSSDEDDTEITVKAKRSLEAAPSPPPSAQGGRTALRPASAAKAIQRPELSVKGLLFSKPNIQAGEEVTVSALVRNGGPGLLRNVKVRFLIDGKRIGHRDLLATIRPGQTVKVKVPFTAETAGRFEVKVVADPNDPGDQLNSRKVNMLKKWLVVTPRAKRADDGRALSTRQQPLTGAQGAALVMAGKPAITWADYDATTSEGGSWFFAFDWKDGDGDLCEGKYHLLYGDRHETGAFADLNLDPNAACNAPAGHAYRKKGAANNRITLTGKMKKELAVTLFVEDGKGNPSNKLSAKLDIRKWGSVAIPAKDSGAKTKSAQVQLDTRPGVKDLPLTATPGKIQTAGGAMVPYGDTPLANLVCSINSPSGKYFTDGQSIVLTIGNMGTAPVLAGFYSVAVKSTSDPTMLSIVDGVAIPPGEQKKVNIPWPPPSKSSIPPKTLQMVPDKPEDQVDKPEKIAAEKEKESYVGVVDYNKKIPEGDAGENDNECGPFTIVTLPKMPAPPAPIDGNFTIQGAAYNYGGNKDRIQAAGVKIVVDSKTPFNFSDAIDEKGAAWMRMEVYNKIWQPLSEEGGEVMLFGEHMDNLYTASGENGSGPLLGLDRNKNYPAGKYSFTLGIHPKPQPKVQGVRVWRMKPESSFETPCKEKYNPVLKFILSLKTKTDVKTKTFILFLKDAPFKHKLLYPPPSGVGIVCPGSYFDDKLNERIKGAPIL